MILKGSKRGGAVDLGKHLLKPENEHIEIHEVRGFVADDVVGALKEVQAISRGTKCRKFLFSLSLNPPETESVPVKAFEDAIEAIEAKLGLSGQPRVIVFHEKEGRRHAHCIWSRINADTMTAIDMPHFKLKLQDVARKLYLDHDWKVPGGLLDSALHNPLNFDRKEWFQARRTGQDPRIIKAFFQQSWAASDSDKAFRQALEQRGYFLARGDRRAVVAVDVHGEVYAVARWANVKSKDVVNRMGDDLAALPSVDEARERIAETVQEKIRGFVGDAITDFRSAAQAVEAKRLAMVERHRADRRDLQTGQDERWIEEARERAERFRRGMLGLWDRLTGKHAKLRQRNEIESAAAATRDAEEKQALIERQLDARRQLQREIVNARRLHTQEVTRLHREISASTNLEQEQNHSPRRTRGLEQRLRL